MSYIKTDKRLRLQCNRGEDNTFYVVGKEVVHCNEIIKKVADAGQLNVAYSFITDDFESSGKEVLDV